MNSKYPGPGPLNRRQFLRNTLLGMAALSFPTGYAVAGSASPGKRKIVWVLLRGALDSLHTVIPTQDPHYQQLRPTLSQSFNQPLLPLNKAFSLHPALKNLYQMYQDKALLPVVAVGSGYPSRSHFDGQDYLESGLPKTDEDSGWLGRAVAARQASALAVSRAKPMSLRSASQVNSWYPSGLDNAEQDFYERLSALYEGNPAMHEALEKGMQVRGLVSSEEAPKRRGRFEDLAGACARLMLEDPKLDCAMLEVGGWDTHNQQANRLNRGLSELDQGLLALQKGLGKEWQNTVIIVATEFGRTAKENGTQGTDHGTASALLLAGGAVRGGQVLGQWPGLAPEQLYEQRDLMPTSNSFDWIATVLHQHWQLAQPELRNVFPQAKVLPQSLIAS
ncbi:DUF1501 domain-containing protein [Alteromonas aestuariivivens]|uniref:DUF1501 domain-containing protein n=2 Tax=Alteromonas aestuariivivens TaxID=1938339 RepID=A0A3D8MA21_9ALTE|nr:DUF1501 domain-containing protein [Alteromonas aestuariivivens]